MKKYVTALAALSALALAGTANAADLPTKAPMAPAPMVAPPFSWTGIYIGINGGAAWAHEDWVDNTLGPASPISLRPDGGVFGGQLGFRWQWNQLVLGIEGTADWADLRDNVATGAFFDELKVKSLYTVTGQVGWAWDRFLVYAKGGWAGATSEANLTGPVTASNSQTHSGWTVGGGIEYAIWQNLIIGVEYDHFDFNFDPFTAAVSNGGGPWIVSSTSRLTVDQVVGRLSYKFDLFR